MVERISRDDGGKMVLVDDGLLLVELPFDPPPPPNPKSRNATFPRTAAFNVGEYFGKVRDSSEGRMPDEWLGWVAVKLGSF